MSKKRTSKQRREQRKRADKAAKERNQSDILYGGLDNGGGRSFGSVAALAATAHEHRVLSGGIGRRRPTATRAAAAAAAARYRFDDGDSYETLNRWVDEVFASFDVRHQGQGKAHPANNNNFHQPPSRSTVSEMVSKFGKMDLTATVGGNTPPDLAVHQRNTTYPSTLGYGDDSSPQTAGVGETVISWGAAEKRLRTLYDEQLDIGEQLELFWRKGQEIQMQIGILKNRLKEIGEEIDGCSREKEEQEPEL